MSLTSRVALAFAIAALILGAAQQSQAALLVYEPFDYVVGSDILGQGGEANGFADSWREHSAGSVPAGSFTTVAGSLAHPSAALPTSGNSALLTGENGTLQPARDFKNELGGADGTTTWISFLGQRMGEVQDPPAYGDNLYPRGVNLSFFDADELANPGRAERTGVGNSSNAETNEWSVIPEGSGTLRVGSGSPYDVLQWAVLRIDYHGDETVADDFYLWLSPDPAVEPALGSADVTIIGGPDASGIDFIRPFVGNLSSGRPAGVLAMDELRIGTTYADMSSSQVIPEPSTLVLLALAGIGLAARRRA